VTLVLIGLLTTLVIGLVAELMLIRRRHRRMEMRMQVYQMVGEIIRKWP
jgi:hypothetical protein